MNGDNVVSMNVGAEIVKPIVEAKVHAALVEALGGKGVLLENVIRVIINQKVDSQGRYSSYSSDKPLIEWMAESLIKNIAQDAVKEFVSSKKDLILAEFNKQFSKKQKTIAEKMVSGIIDSTACNWGFALSVTYKDQK
jgi:hypothetical protein